MLLIGMLKYPVDEFIALIGIEKALVVDRVSEDIKRTPVSQAFVILAALSVR